MQDFFCETLRWCSVDVSFFVCASVRPCFWFLRVDNIPFSVCELRGGEPHQDIGSKAQYQPFFQFDAVCAVLCSEITGSWWVEHAGARYCTER